MEYEKYSLIEEKKERNELVYALRKAGVGYATIASNPKVIELSGNKKLTKARITQIINKFKKREEKNGN